MMETERMKKFLQLQCCVLLLLLTLLPEFSLLSLFGGIDINIPVFCCKIGGIIGGGMALYAFYQMAGQEKTSLPTPFLISSCAGIGLVLLTMIPSIPSWLEYVALAALAVTLFLSKSSLNIQWNTLAPQGSYLVLLAVVLHLFNGVNDTTMTKIAAMVGLVIYLIGLGKMKSALDELGMKGASKLTIAVIFGLIAIPFSWIPLVGSFICGILGIIAFFFEFMGYGLLKNSESVGNEGRIGAGKLRISMIVLLIGAIIGFIPIIGSKIEAFISLVALWMIFQGWTKIVIGVSQKKLTI